MVPLLIFIAYLISLYEIVVIAAVILSLLISFNVVNAYNPFVKALWQAFNAVTEPFLRRIRAVIPSAGPLDLSPIVLLLACLFLRQVVIYGWMVPAFS